LLEVTGVTGLWAKVIGVLRPDGPDAGATNGRAKPGNGGEATALDFKVGEVRKHHWVGRYAYFARFSPDGRYYVATGAANGPNTVRVWELASGKLVLEVKGNEFALFTPDSQRLIAAGPDKRIHVWDLAARQHIAQFGEHPDWVILSSLSADGKQLLTGCSDGIVRLWDVAEGKEIARLESDNKLHVPYFCPDGQKAITLDWPTNIIRLWDLAQRKEIRRWQQPDPVTGFLAFLPGGQRFVTSGSDTVYFWDMAAEKETQTLRLVGKMVDRAFSPDGSRLLYAVAGDPMVRLVELPGGKELATFDISNESDGKGFGVAFSPDGRFAVAAHTTGVVQLWRLPDPPALGKK
jgi:WD40 repeat protein